MVETGGEGAPGTWSGSQLLRRGRRLGLVRELLPLGLVDEGAGGDAGGRLRAGAAAARARAGCAWACRAAGGGRKAAGRVALSRWLGGDWSGGAGEWDGAKWRRGSWPARKMKERRLRVVGRG